MLVGKFPQKALPVLNKIRDEVKRPSLRSCKFDEDLDCIRWSWKDGEYCPMGMLKEATMHVPLDKSDFEYTCKLTNNQIRLFANWFDKQTDKVAVVDFIWGS